MDQVCFNCFKPGHLSIRCPVRSKYTRCCVCNRVCEKSEDHFWACANKEFVLQFIERPDGARSATLVADIEFCTNSALYLLNGLEQMNISGDFLPIQVDANNGLLLGNQKNLKYYHWYPAANRRCVINVMDATNIVRFSVRFMLDAIIVENFTFEIPRGQVIYMPDQLGNI